MRMTAASPWMMVNPPSSPKSPSGPSTQIMTTDRIPIEGEYSNHHHRHLHAIMSLAFWVYGPCVILYYIGILYCQRFRLWINFGQSVYLKLWIQFNVKNFWRRKYVSLCNPTIGVWIVCPIITLFLTRICVFLLHFVYSQFDIQRLNRLSSMRHTHHVTKLTHCWISTILLSYGCTQKRWALLQG